VRKRSFVDWDKSKIDAGGRIEVIGDKKLLYKLSKSGGRWWEDMT
jgi:hypothetical protein